MEASGKRHSKLMVRFRVSEEDRRNAEATGIEAAQATGPGVHTEFYTLCARELQRRATCAMWIPDDDTEREFVATEYLLPRPLLGASPEEEARACEGFRLFGRLVGRGLMDEQLLAVPLHPVCIDLLLGRRAPGVALLTEVLGPEACPAQTPRPACCSAHS